MNNYRSLGTGLAFALISSHGIMVTTALAASPSAPEVKHTSEIEDTPRLTRSTDPRKPAFRPPSRPNQTHEIKKTLPHQQRVNARKSEERRIAISQAKGYDKQLQALMTYYQTLALSARQKSSGEEGERHVASLTAAVDHFKGISEAVKRSKQGDISKAPGFPLNPVVNNPTKPPANPIGRPTLNR